jgi:DNA helicase-2/ATP-dependent DNA helicase PcrA
LAGKMSLSEVVRALVDELGILRMFKDEGTVESMARWENVHELLSAISEFGEEHPEGRLEDFLQEVSLVSDIDTFEGTKNAVTLMTLHSSKGLEFPAVFIAGLEEGLLPFYNGMIERQELEEERRLFYVGMTRAQKKLFITRARSRYRYGDLTYASESRFLAEIGESEGIRRNGAAPSRLWPATRHSARRSVVPQRTLADVESHFEDSTSEYESESTGVADVKKGATVDHATFGRGRVIEVSGKGESKKAVVQFDEYGMKTLILKFANLKRI